MSYELVLAIIPPDTSDPVERVYELMDPFFHAEECWENGKIRKTTTTMGQYLLPGCEHFWDGANVGGRYHFSRCLWRDRYGLPLPKWVTP